jgi:hypothetical protein
MTDTYHGHGEVYERVIVSVDMQQQQRQQQQFAAGAQTEARRARARAHGPGRAYLLRSALCDIVVIVMCSASRRDFPDLSCPRPVPTASACTRVASACSRNARSN